jgi:hypothetical protein
MASVKSIYDGFGKRGQAKKGLFLWDGQRAAGSRDAVTAVTSLAGAQSHTSN